MDVEDLRLAVYEALAQTGQAPSVVALAGLLEVADAEVRSGLAVLHDQRHVVLDPGDRDRIVMAHPFATVPLGFSVMGRATLWWGGCAWDSFAIPHVVATEPEVLVATTCPGCGRALAWRVGGTEPPDGTEVAHFLTPTAHMWDDVVETCSNQRVFCGAPCVDRWLDETGRVKGYVMDLATLWRLAEGWYRGRLDRGYTRREPAAAKAYFASVGLEGPFWGL